MDTVQQLNVNSALFRSLESVQSSNLSYGIPENYPNLSKDIVALQPLIAVTTGTFYAKECNFALPRQYLLQDITIQTICNSTNGIYSSTYLPGLCVFDRIELKARGIIICSNTQNFILCRVSESPINQRLSYERMAAQLPQNLAIAAPTTNCTFYTPVFMFFKERVRSALDLTWVENLTLRCVFGSSTTTTGWGAPTYTSPTVSGVAATDATAVTVQAFVKGFRLAPNDWKELQSQNFSLSEPSNILIYDCYDEPPLTCTSGGSTTIPQKQLLYANQAIFKSYIRVHNNQAGAGRLLPPDNTAAGYIDAVSFKLLGKYVWQNIPTPILWTDQEKFGSADISVAYGTSTIGSNGSVALSLRLNKPISLCWGLENSWVFNSGGISFDTRATPYFEYYFNLDPTIYNDIRVTHCFYSILTIDSSGNISVSSSA